MAMNEEIKEKIIDILSILFQNAVVDTDMLEYVDLIDDLGMDSIKYIAIIVEIENMFEITVPDALLDVKKFRNISGIVQLIEYLLKNDTSNESRCFDD